MTLKSALLSLGWFICCETCFCALSKLYWILWYLKKLKVAVILLFTCLNFLNSIFNYSSSFSGEGKTTTKFCSPKNGLFKWKPLTFGPISSDAQHLGSLQSSLIEDSVKKRRFWVKIGLWKSFKLHHELHRVGHVIWRTKKATKNVFGRKPKPIRADQSGREKIRKNQLPKTRATQIRQFRAIDLKKKWLLSIFYMKNMHFFELFAEKSDFWALFTWKTSISLGFLLKKVTFEHFLKEKW